MAAIIKRTIEVPTISIVTPSFNQGEYLEEALDSLLSQGYPRLELIVMDGGSEDDSVPIIKKYARHLAHWESAPDSGQYDAINRGLARSTGTIMGWLNSDDRHLPKSLFKIALLFLGNRNMHWVTGRHSFWNEHGEFTGTATQLYLWSAKALIERLELGVICPQQESTFWSRSLWNAAGARVDHSLSYAGDFELWCRFARQAELHSFDGALAGFRRQPRQKTALNMAAYVDEARQVIERYRSDLERVDRGMRRSLIARVQEADIERLITQCVTRGGLNTAPEDGPFVFHHVPKCAGTSLRDVLEQWFSLLLDYRDDEEGALGPPHDVGQYDSGHCIAGHFELPGAELHRRYPDLLARGDRVFTFLREPLEQRKSLFRYRRSRGLVPEHESMRDNVLADPNFVAHILGVDESNYRERLDKYLFVGLVEHLPEDVARLAEVLGQPLVDLPRANRTEAAPDDTLTADDEREFRERNALDYAIYEYAKILRRRDITPPRLASAPLQKRSVAKTSPLRPRIVICFGMPKSASSFVWQVVTEIVSSESEQEQLRRDMPPGFQKRYVESSLDTWLEVMLANLSPNARFVIKTHSPPSEMVARRIDDGECTAVVSIRDPYDIVASMLDAGKRERKRPAAAQRSFFAQMFTVEDVLPHVRQMLPAAAAWVRLATKLGLPVVRYPEVEHEPERVARRIANSFWQDADCEEIVGRLTQDRKKRVLEFNKGVSGRGRPLFDNVDAPGVLDAFDHFNRKYLSEPK